MSSLPLSESLESILTSGHLTDVTFLVGGGEEGGQREIHAHKSILAARSKVFEIMVEPRWNNPEESVTTVKIGPKSRKTVATIEIGPESRTRIKFAPVINPLAFEQIIKFAYTDNVDGCLDALSVEDLFDLSALAGMYEFSQLKEAASLKIAMECVRDYRNCFTVLEEELEDGNLREVAFAVIKRNLGEALEAEDMPVKWTEEIWEDVLEDETQIPKSHDADNTSSNSFVEEIDYFRNLCRWKDHDLSRKKAFYRLLKLVRFPLISKSTLLTEVRATGVLKAHALWDILQCEHDDATTEQKRTKRVYWVTNSKELTEKLNRLDEDMIEVKLLPGEYSGVINISQNFLTFTGFGPYTIFQRRQSGIKITSNNVTIENFTFSSKISILYVTGNSNTVRDVEVRSTIKNQMFGLVITGKCNTFEYFFFESRFDNSTASGPDFEYDVAEFTALCKGQGLPYGWININHPTTFPARFVSCEGPDTTIREFSNKFTNKNTMDSIPHHLQMKFIIDAQGTKLELINFKEASPIYLSEKDVPPMGARLDLVCFNIVISHCCFSEVKVHPWKHQYNVFKKVIVGREVDLKYSTTIADFLFALSGSKI